MSNTRPSKAYLREAIRATAPAPDDWAHEHPGGAGDLVRRLLLRRVDRESMIDAIAVAWGRCQCQGLCGPHSCSMCSALHFIVEQDEMAVRGKDDALLWAGGGWPAEDDS